MNSLVNGWANALQPLLSNPFQDFLAAHPVLAWGLEHPLWVGAIALLTLLLLAGLWSAIARLTENFWLALVQLPFRLVRWLLGSLARLRRRPQAVDPAPDRPSQIMQRLEALQQEQGALVRELRSLLAEPPQK